MKALFHSLLDILLIALAALLFSFFFIACLFTKSGREALTADTHD